jgi:hypothetical protein
MPQPLGCTIRAILGNTEIWFFFTENKQLNHASIADLKYREYEISYNIESIFPKLDHNLQIMGLLSSWM